MRLFFIEEQSHSDKLFERNIFRYLEWKYLVRRESFHIDFGKQFIYEVSDKNENVKI